MGTQNREIQRDKGQIVANQVGNQTETAGYSGEYLDLQAVSVALGVSMNTVRRKRKAGELVGAVLQPSAKGERWVIPVETVRKLQGEQGGQGSLVTTQVTAQVGTQVDTQAAELAEKVQRLEAELAAKRGEIEQQREYSAKVAADLQHQVELMTLRADSHEQIALERLRTIQMQDLTLQLTQRKVLELETSSAKKRRWWQKAKEAETTPTQGTAVTDTTVTG